MTAGDWRARAGTVFTLEKQPATASRSMVVNGVSDPVRAGLADRGHQTVAVPAVGGGMNAIAMSGDGVLTGAACWRADGTPVGVSGGRARPSIRFRPEAGRR